MRLRDKLILAGLVLATGTSGAMWFRKPLDERNLPTVVSPFNGATAHDSPVVLREQFQPSRPEWNVTAHETPATNPLPLVKPLPSPLTNPVVKSPQSDGDGPLPNIAPNFQPAFNIGAGNLAATTPTNRTSTNLSSSVSGQSTASPWSTEPRKETSPVSFAPLTQPLHTNNSLATSPFGTSSSLSLATGLSAASLPNVVEKPITHKVLDGDTLARLSEQYLGSPLRRLEIFEANREVLKNPDILPIGVEIKIPPKVPVAVSTPVNANSMDTLPPLTPVGRMTVGGR